MKIPKKPTKKFTLIVLAIVFSISLVTHLAYFNSQKSEVFDEVHFIKFSNAYYTKQYVFDIHPPLGKLIIASAQPSKLFSSQAQLVDKEDFDYFRYRLFPLLAGILLPVVVVLIALHLGMSYYASSALGLALTFENALITQGRLALLDCLLLFFGFMAILFYLRYRGTKKPLYLVCAGTLLGCAVSVKWTALSFFTVIALFYLWDVFKLRQMRLKKMIYGALALIIIPLTVYVAVFSAHFSLLKFSGEGDVYMSRQFQQGLIGSIHYGNLTQPPNFLDKFIELNKVMYSSNSNIASDHPYRSKWYSWPIIYKPVWYFVSSDGYANIYLLGNPALWWLGGLSIIGLVFLILAKSKKGIDFYSDSFILVGFFASWLPFILISRQMFLYHYFPALVFSIIALFKLVDSSRFRKQLLALLLVAVFACYLYFAPLAYGLPLLPLDFQSKLWLPSWH